MRFFHTYHPCEALKVVVEFYWHSKYDSVQPVVQEINTPLFQALTFNLSGKYEDLVFEEGCLHMDKPCYLIGQPLSKRMSLSNPKGIDILGVKFTTLGMYLLTGINMQHIANWNCNLK